MTSFQPFGVPSDHVEAELAALPIASEASFISSSVELDPVTCRQKDLWRAAERDILASIPFLALDEFAATRDRVWFGNAPEIGIKHSRVTLDCYLRQLSERYLKPLECPIDPASPSLRRQGPSARTRRRWSWLCRALPPDLLQAARSEADADDFPYCLNPMVEHLLSEHGFAETHLHLGAAADFPLLWANLMHALAVDEIRETSMSSPGACFDDGTKLAKWILWAAVMRLILAEWLFAPNHSIDNGRFLKCLSGPWRVRMNAGLQRDLVRLTSEIANGREGSPPLPYVRGRSIYRSLIRPLPHLARSRERWTTLRARRRPDSRQEVLQNDPLASIVGWSGTCRNTPESILVRESLNFMEKNDGTGDFAQLFWQVIRVRCLAYRHLVQRPLTPGLQWFVRSFARIQPFKQSLPHKVSMSAAFRQSGSRKGLRSLEVRLGTEESVSECLNKLLQVEASLPQCRTNVDKIDEFESKDTKTEIGAVFHFSRNRGGGWKQGSPNAYGLDRSYPGIPREKALRTHQDVGNPSGYRFARFYLEQRRHAQALVSVLQGFPDTLRTFRGVDLCTDEAGVPIWVMAPLIRWVREAGRYAAIQLRRRGMTGVSQLRTTVHAGEDFVHLLTGLRRLDEAIEYLGLVEGDRIGHGLALGLDPVTWARRTERILQSKEERLFDLLWELDCYATLHVEAQSARLAYLHNTIARLGRDVFGRSLTLQELRELVRVLNDEEEVRKQGYPDRATRRTSTTKRSDSMGSDAQDLLNAFLRSAEVWRNGRALEVITLHHIGHELEALTRLQNALRRKIGTLGLTVEVTPSSNLMVADLGFLEEHPIWRLMPFRPVDDIPPLSVCIGSDDPLTFATSLPQEYQLLYDTVVLADQSHEVALDWLDKARAAGMRGRFTLPRSIAGHHKKLLPNLKQENLPKKPP